MSDEQGLQWSACCSSSTSRDLRTLITQWILISFNYPVAAQFAHFLNFIKYMNMHRHETKRKKSLFGTFHTHTSMFRHKIITFIMSSFSIHGFFCMLFQYWRLDNKVDNLRNWKQGLGVAVFCLDFLLGAMFFLFSFDRCGFVVCLGLCVWKYKFSRLSCKKKGII